jgi:hypothetical protein
MRGTTTSLGNVDRVIVRHAEPVGGRWLVLDGEADGAPARRRIDLGALAPGRWPVDGAFVDGEPAGLGDVTVDSGGRLLRVAPRVEEGGGLALDVAPLAPHAEAGRIEIAGDDAVIALREA